MTAKANTKKQAAKTKRARQPATGKRAANTQAMKAARAKEGKPTRNTKTFARIREARIKNTREALDTTRYLNELHDVECELKHNCLVLI